MPDLKRIRDSFSSTHWRWEIHSAADCPPDLLAALRLALPHIPAESWAERLSWGGVFLNGRPVGGNRILTLPCAIEYYEPRFDFRRAAEHFPPFKKQYLVYEDADLIVAFKPAELPCQPAREQTHFCLKNYLQDLCGAVVHMPSRLDMSAQGLVAVSRSPRMHAPLQRAFEQRRIGKVYIFETAGRPEWEARRVESGIARDARHPVLRRSAAQGGKPAVTEMRRLSSRGRAGGALSAVEARPLTGRTHQIRVHAADLGCPIIGDNFYGGAPADELHLLSFRLEFDHPISAARLEIELPQTLWPDWLRAHDCPGFCHDP